ncbi:hypothetical protein [Cupriavidus pauculus]|nr:hypothetical protein [Cupriavidus pauculus]
MQDEDDDWISPQLAALILEQERLGEWSEDMTLEQFLAGLEMLSQTIH